MVVVEIDSGGGSGGVCGGSGVVEHGRFLPWLLSFPYTLPSLTHSPPHTC